MEAKQFDIWMADLNIRKGVDAGMNRPVCILQTNLLPDFPSILVAPLTSKVYEKAELLRIHLTKKDVTGLEKNGDIMIDQIRSIDRNRLLKKLGTVLDQKDRIIESIKVVFDIDL